MNSVDNNCDHEVSKQAEMRASRAKILLQETVEAKEIDEEKWTKLKGRSIVSGERHILHSDFDYYALCVYERAQN